MGRRCSNRAGCRTPRRSTTSSLLVGGSPLGGLFVGVAILCGLGACGTTDEASRQTLPPLVTTTTSTTTTTTLPTDETYTIQAGDSLIVIAAQRGVTVEAIMELNDIENANDIEAGQTIRIPG